MERNLRTQTINSILKLKTVHMCQFLFLSKIIKERIDLGLQIDHSIYEDFEKKTKHFNFIFSSGNDFIYELFKFDNKYKNNYLNQLVKFLGKNKLFNNIVSKYADQGLSI